MIPLKDELPTRRFPVLTVALVIANVLVFLIGFSPASNVPAGINRTTEWVYEWGAYPCELAGRCDITSVRAVATNALGQSVEQAQIEVRHHPAWLVAGVWAIGQVVATGGMVYAPGGGGVAYMAHVAGFAFGLATIRLIATRSELYDELYGGG